MQTSFSQVNRKPAGNHEFDRKFKSAANLTDYFGW